MDALTRLHRSLAGGDDDEEQPEDSILGDTEGICSLSPVQRVYGFAACLVAGLALMILSLVVFIRPIKFAVMFTFGNILAVGSTAFLIGPSQQLRMMLDPVRVYATAIYGGFVFLALIFALWIHSKVLTLIAIICEICALFWYSLSYIPFARRMVSDLMDALSDLPSPATARATATRERGREGEDDGAEEAPEAAARRPRLRLVTAGFAAAAAAEEAGEEAGRAAGGSGSGSCSCSCAPITSGEEAADVRAGDHPEPRRWASAIRVLPVRGAAPGVQASARLLPRSPSPSLRLVSDSLCSLCVRAWLRVRGAYRIGGFLLESPYMLLTAKLAVPQWLPPQEDGPQIAIEMTGACVLPNARPGIWITDFHLVRCPNCTLNKCAGVLQVLDARHCELFLEQGFWNGTWEYEDLGDHYNDEVTPTAACAIFNASTRAHESISCVLHSKSWVRRCDDPQPKAHCRPYAVALNSNLLSNSNQGLVSRFQAMRDTTRNGQIVSIRITQQIY
uniref:Vesicle transport protein n=1 Tax=Oryza meridionalis TaxID=40149 RepID=A0A0E0BZ35_9ORYZ